MSHDEFTQLFKYMQNEFRRVNKRFDEIDEKFSSTISAVDSYAKQTEIYHHEMLALGFKVNRHDRWIHKLAKASDTQLSA